VNSDQPTENQRFKTPASDYEKGVDLTRNLGNIVIHHVEVANAYRIDLEEGFQEAMAHIKGRCKIA
jgi:hypothetical protein